MLNNIVYVKNNFPEVILVGDFNLPSANWNTLTSNDSYTTKFLEVLDDTGLEQIIQEPTRYRINQIPSLLDLILVDDPEIICGIIISDSFGKSDHCKIEFKIKNSQDNSDNNMRKYNFRKMDEEIFVNEINAIDWNSVFNGDLDEAYDKFVGTVQIAIQRSTPKMNRIDRNAAPWSNKIIANLARNKRKRWDRYKHTKSMHDYDAYKTALHKFNHEKDLAIERYETKIITDKSTKKKHYYNYVARKNKYGEKNIVLKNGNSMECGKQKCAEILNSYFTSVYNSGTADISNLEVLTSQEYPDMPEINIEAVHVRAEINKLDTSKSTGPDEIPALLLKRFCDLFVPILVIIYRKSYHEGKVPTHMKKANISPIFKAGDRTDPSNYRPVSITPIIAKIFERIIKESIEQHVANNYILSEFQHGFRRNRSTSTNLIQFMNDLANYANESKSISIVYTDLRKAFDCVPHDLLLFKLSKYGITGKTNLWLEDFLANRLQKVRIGDEYSTSSEVLSGVPQGGALSGLLFSLYINDLAQHIEKASISLYADDAKIYLPIVSEESVADMQEDLNRMTKWCHDWRMSINPTKCYLLQYNPRATTRQFNPGYNIGNEPIRRSATIKDLGILMSEQLKFHSQVDHACRRAHAEINRIRRSFVCRSPKFIADMYKMFVRPHLEYAVEVWNPCSRGDILKMEKVQNKMTKLIPAGNLLNPHERNSALGLTTHEERRLRGDLINMYKHIENPSLFRMRNEPRFRGHSKTICIPISNCLIKKHSFSARSINKWNALPESVVNSENLNSFKRNIDIYMSAN